MKSKKILAKNLSFLQLGTVNLHNENAFHFKNIYVIFLHFWLNESFLIIEKQRNEEKIFHGRKKPGFGKKKKVGKNVFLGKNLT